MIPRPTPARPRPARGAPALLLALSLALAHAPRGALAQPAAGPQAQEAAREARERFQRGVELYKEGDFRAALLEFRHAHRLSPNYIVLFNIGQAHYELRDYAGAKAAFESFLKEGGAAVSPERRRQVEAELARLASRVAFIEVKTNAEGAEVSVDDVPAAKTPLSGPLVVSAGRRKLTLTKAPAPPVTRYVDVAGGVHETVELALPTAPAPALAAPERRDAIDARPAPEPLPSYAPVWVGVAATGALGMGTLAAGLFSLSAQDRLDRRLDRAPADEAGVEELRDEVRRWSLATDIAGGATALAAGITLYLYVNRRSERARQLGAAPAAGLAWGPRGLTLSGHF
jgi:hypothetical protein